MRIRGKGKRETEQANIATATCLTDQSKTPVVILTHKTNFPPKMQV